MGASFTLLIALGVATHLSIYRHLDSVKYGPKLTLAVFVGPTIVFLGLWLLNSLTLLQAALQTTAWVSTYIVGVLMSMTIYRLFFHPLKSYPGPFLAKITQWYYVFKVGPKLNQHWYLESLHKQYGEYVRIGPNAISVADPAIVDMAFGPSTKFRKSNWYMVGYPITSLQQMTDIHLHDRRRRHGWDKVRIAQPFIDSNLTSIRRSRRHRFVLTTREL